MKRKSSGLLEEENKEEDILSRFTDPVKKKKKRQKKLSEEEQKCKDIQSVGKKYHVDFYNNPLTEKEYNLFKSFVVSSPENINCNEILDKLQNANIEDIPFTKQNNKRGLSYVLGFIVCSAECVNWLNKRLCEVGWTKNMTSYNPVAVSHSVEEVVEATLECYKMACKQMIIFKQYTVK
jgi:hypothetical protein